MKKYIGLIILCVLLMSCFQKNTMKTAKEYQRVLPEEVTKKKKKKFKVKRFEAKDFTQPHNDVWKAAISTFEFFEAKIIREFKDENKLIAKVNEDFIVVWVEPSKTNTSNITVSVKVLPKLTTYMATEVNEERFFEKLADFMN